MTSSTNVTQQSSTSSFQTSPSERDADDKTKKYSGSCHCGVCQFECSGTPIFRVICHCSICTRISGGIAVAFVGFDNAGLKLICGSEHLRGYKATERMERFHCRICGSNVYNQSLIIDRQFRDTPLTGFKTDDNGVIISLDELKPNGHINYSNCQKCYSDVFKFDGLVKFSAMPGSAIIPNDESSILNNAQ